MKNQFTPGPWTVGREIEVHIVDGSGPRVASAETNTRETEEESANACLIAAAPDLLEACKHALAIFKEYDESGFAGTIVAKRMLEAAIQKAEGNQ